jgi:hypothetical protein
VPIKAEGATLLPQAIQAFQLPASSLVPRNYHQQQGAPPMSNPTQVTRSRFELSQDGQTSYLEFETDSQGWLTLWHTEVPEALRGKGIAVELVTTAFQYAKDNNLKVDVVCPLAQHVVRSHPEFQSLVHSR